MRAGIALGSNLDNRREYLHSAREKILQIAHGNAPFLFSSLYETDPIGCEPGAQKFLNAVMEMDYEGEPEELLSELRRIEESLDGLPNTCATPHAQLTSTCFILAIAQLTMRDCNCHIRVCMSGDLFLRRWLIFGRT